ncbi:MAG: hypothetical protein VW339_11820 [Quisquiliibacterium sp.]
MLTKLILGLIGLALSVTFFAIPIIKVQETALIVVVLIGVAMSVYEFIEELRSPD